MVKKWQSTVQRIKLQASLMEELERGEGTSDEETASNGETLDWTCTEVKKTVKLRKWNRIIPGHMGLQDRPRYSYGSVLCYQSNSNRLKKSEKNGEKTCNVNK